MMKLFYRLKTLTAIAPRFSLRIILAMLRGLRALGSPLCLLTLQTIMTEAVLRGTVLGKKLSGLVLLATATVGETFGDFDLLWHLCTPLDVNAL
jgi:hypothetical protein